MADGSGDGLDVQLAVWLQRMSIDNKLHKQYTSHLVDLFSQFNIPAEFVNLLIITASNGTLQEYLRNLSSLLERTVRRSQVSHLVHGSDQDVLPPIPLEEGERNELEELVSSRTTNTLYDTDSNDLFEHTRNQVNEALRELVVITTHDDNLERQYKEVCAQCSKLFSDLDRAKREVFKLRGKISIAEMTPERIRVEMNRQRDRNLRAQQMDRPDELAEVLGEKPVRKHKQRFQIPSPIPVTRAPKKRARHADIPPPVEGCQCSVCKTVQGLGSTMLIPVGLDSIQSGQQLMLGDRVVVKGQRPGTVRYLGKLEGHKTEIDNEVFAGVQLDHPMGVHNGTFGGKRYFSCPAKHGVFLPLRDVICVTNRAVVSLSNSLALRRAKKRQEAEERAKRQVLLEQERAYQSKVHELRENEQKHCSLEDINVLSLETPHTSSKTPGRRDLLLAGIQTAEKARQIHSTDFSKAKPDSEIREMRNRMDSLLLKSRSIYDESHRPNALNNREKQPESLSSFPGPAEEGTRDQGRREVSISVTH